MGTTLGLSVDRSRYRLLQLIDLYTSSARGREMLGPGPEVTKLLTAFERRVSVPILQVSSWLVARMPSQIRSLSREVFRRLIRRTPEISPPTDVYLRSIRDVFEAAPNP